MLNLLRVALASRIYRSYANHTSNMGIKPNLEAEVVLHLIMNRIERFIIQLWPLLGIHTINPFMSSVP